MSNQPAIPTKLPLYKRGRTPVEVIEAYSIPVTECGCWIWLGAYSPQGYGTTRYKGTLTKAHRLSWIAHRGPIPKGQLVLHKCDTPACVNPDHLFIGNAVDNSLDMLKKKRGNKAKGVDNGWSKLDPRMVRMARAYAFKANELASVFGVHETTIERIRSRKIWSHVQ